MGGREKYFAPPFGVSKFNFKRPNRKYSVFSLRLRKMSSAAPFRASNGARLHLLSGFVDFSRHFRFDNVKRSFFFLMRRPVLPDRPFAIEF